MKTIETTLTTTVLCSDDGTKRYLLSKTWDAKKPRLAVIMLTPSISTEVILDASSRLTVNNAFRLGFGSVDILNLFATVDDFDLKQAEEEDAENIKAIVASAEKSDVVVYASGVGKAKNKAFQQRQKQILMALQPFEGKLCCLTNKNGEARLQHPLSPAVRTWELSPLKVAELLPTEVKAKPVQKKSVTGKGKAEEKAE